MRTPRLTPLLVIAMLGAATPAGTAAAQTVGSLSATSCANEAQRLSDGFSPSGSAAGTTVTPGVPQPGMRAGSSLDVQSQQQARDLADQARTAGGRGDATGCLQNLNQVPTVVLPANAATAKPVFPMPGYKKA